MTDMIDKIAALKAKIPENGATEEEAMAALAIAEKLMEKHGVTEADLKKVEFSRDMRQGGFEQTQKQEHPSQKYCDVTISEYCGTIVWNGKIGKKKTTEIFGFEGDVTMHEFLLGLIHDSMNRGWKEFLKLNINTGRSRHVEYWSFMIGFAERINSKLNELIDGRTTQVDSTGMDLVIVKEAIIEQGLNAMLPSAEFSAQKAGRIRVNLDAYGQGQAAGDKVNLQRPINQQTSSVKRIT